MASTRKRRYSQVNDSSEPRWGNQGGGSCEQDTNNPRTGGREPRHWSRARGRRARGRSRHVPALAPPKRRRTESERRETFQEKETHPLGYMALKEICDSNCPEDGILELANKSKRFEALLNCTEIRPDLMKLIIRAVHLCALSDQVTQHAEKILRIVIRTKFLLLHLSSFVRKIPLHSITDDKFQPNDVILQLAETFLVLLQRFRHDIVDTTPIAELSEALEKLKSDVSLQVDTEMLEKKVIRVKELRDEIIRRRIESLRKQDDESALEPPDDFRKVRVIPQADDLKVHDKPFLRANIVGGSYIDLEHYLDVQFRLMREDFIIPLRQGIKELRRKDNNCGASIDSGRKHSKDVSVYRDVTVLYPVCSGKGMVYRIRFDWLHRSVRHVKWEKSKQLKFGSLLCLSADDFYNLLFATVENRNPGDLRCGELEVRFEGVQLEKLNEFIKEKKKFDMVESPAFFETYRHVLEGLQKIQPGELPFQEHIVKCNPNVGPPGYESKTNGFFVMSDITDKEVEENNIGLLLHNNMEGDNDDNQSASTEDSFRGWVLRTWDSDSDGSEWLPVDPDVLPEGDSASLDSDVFSMGESEDSPLTSSEDSLFELALCKSNLDFEDNVLRSVDSNATLNSDSSPSFVQAAPSSSNFASDDASEASEESDAFDPGPEVLNIYDLELHHESLGFNASQMRAFKIALAKKIAVIQGPPGTGKTYVGQKIARVLLQSASLWQDEEKLSPILMVSYTNHALDEFLEGLPKEGIVRVGGRCSEKMKCCSLKCRRDDAREKRSVPKKITKARLRARDELRELQKDLDFQRSVVVLKFSRRGILSFQVLKQFMSGSHVGWFRDKAIGSIESLLLDWLAVKMVASKESDKKVYHDVTNNADFKMQVSFREFANEEDFEDENQDFELNPSKLVLYRTEETNRPIGLCKDLQRNEIMSAYEEQRTHDLWKLPSDRRWKLYRLWLQRAEEHYLNNLQSVQPDYERVLARKYEVMQEEDFYVLRNARVIGMTTTCAARYRKILQRISPKIVLVEEAAEVLEAHIITSLTKGCQHLILIGDHQQLRPNPAVYELAKKYNLGVSLFERMVTVGIPCERLSVQHRMRPEIAAVMKHIYDNLENHESVQNYEDIKGMKKNMFFLNHNHLENNNDESHSHTNKHEAKFLVALCRYLLQQTYSARQITILTTYTGQMFAIRDFIKQQNSEDLESVRLTTVDNFQGEENDIILLSLVRSNKSEKVGFIKIVNRACVALSRAKKGFYCIGNFDLLSKYSEFWRKVVNDLKGSESIGNAMSLVCQIHDKEVTVATAEEFLEKVPNGGCLRPCQVRLSCGHTCRLTCHPKDQDHEEYLCEKECPRIIKGCSHLCPKRCYQECETDCPEVVEKKLPSCGHRKEVRCGQDVTRVKCKLRCEKILSKCGHRCQALCGERCTTKCKEIGERRVLPCGHEVSICSASPSDCRILCEENLECGHRCKGTCGECRMGRVHKRCSEKCGRLLVCSHVCKVPCTNSCPSCFVKCENRCVHNYCRAKCGELCVPCNEKCEWKCRHYKCTKLCGQLCNRPRCDEPCKKRLSCGERNNRHRCRGLCGEPCICALCEKNDKTIPITKFFLGSEDEKDALFIQLPDCKHIFAVKDLDRHMDTSPDNSIQLKSCPRCTTPIRRSLRYGNVIKQQLQNIEEVKKKVIGHSSELEEAKGKLKKRLNDLKNQFSEERNMVEWKRLEWRVERMSKGIMAAVTENQVTLMERYYHMSDKLKKGLLNDVAHREASSESRLEGCLLQEELDHFKKRFMPELATEKELQDINLEFTRLYLQLELCLLKHDVMRLNLTLDETFRHVVQEIRDDLSSGKLIEAEKLDKLLEKLVEIRNAYPALVPLTPEERKQIVSAVGLKQGHWFKCPKGHVYAIGECGGAMERGKCPDCGAVIGGANHALEEGNELAPEMDGARHAAWSEQANLENYLIVDEA